jgi:acyl-CoA reductase-like NAD-dependent aldehyde dehydrogenase
VLDEAGFCGVELVCVFKMDRQGYKNGYYVRGSLIDEATPDLEIRRWEIFGPVLSIVRRKSFPGAVELISAHEYADGVAIFTRAGDARPWDDAASRGRLPTVEDGFTVVFAYRARPRRRSPAPESGPDTTS